MGMSSPIARGLGPHGEQYAATPGHCCFHPRFRHNPAGACLGDPWILDRRRQFADWTEYGQSGCDNHPTRRAGSDSWLFVGMVVVRYGLGRISWLGRRRLSQCLMAGESGAIRHLRAPPRVPVVAYNGPAYRRRHYVGKPRFVVRPYRPINGCVRGRYGRVVCR
jgi:hypothetical protein